MQYNVEHLKFSSFIRERSISLVKFTIGFFFFLLTFNISPRLFPATIIVYNSVHLLLYLIFQLSRYIWHAVRDQKFLFS